MTQSEPRESTRGHLSAKAKAVVGGAVVLLTLLLAYAAVLASVTQFKPVNPDLDDADEFLVGYYKNVVNPELVQSVWDTKLDDSFKRALKTRQGITFDTPEGGSYRDYRLSVGKVDVGRVDTVPDSKDIATELKYSYKDGRNTRPELTQFTLNCPAWTAVTIVGCNANNVRIHSTRVID